MKIKLDENIGRQGALLVRLDGHDVMTVRDEDLGGVTDAQLFDVCCSEARTLVTLDRDFGQVLRFPPERAAGIIILDSSPRATSAGLAQQLVTFLTFAQSRSPVGELWIVEPGRVRIHLKKGT